MHESGSACTEIFLGNGANNCFANALPPVLYKYLGTWRYAVSGQSSEDINQRGRGQHRSARQEVALKLNVPMMSYR